MPMSGRCVLAFSCTGPYITDGGGDCQFSVALHIGRTLKAESARKANSYP